MHSHSMREERCNCVRAIVRHIGLSTKVFGHCHHVPTHLVTSFYLQMAGLLLFMLLPV